MYRSIATGASLSHYNQFSLSISKHTMQSTLGLWLDVSIYSIYKLCFQDQNICFTQVNINMMRVFRLPKVNHEYAYTVLSGINFGCNGHVSEFLNIKSSHVYAIMSESKSTPNTYGI